MKLHICKPTVVVETIPIPKGVDPDHIVGACVASITDPTVLADTRLIIADDIVSTTRVNHFLLFGDDDINDTSGGSFHEVNMEDVMREFSPMVIDFEKRKSKALQDVDRQLRNGTLDKGLLALATQLTPQIKQE